MGTAGAIDGDIVYDKFHDKYIMYYDGKRISESDKISGQWVHTQTKYSDGQLPVKTAGGASMAVEGSNIWKIIDEDKWVIAADGTAFNGGCYAMIETTDFENYTQLWESKGEYSFDFTPRHGYVIPISKRELNNLFEKYGSVELPEKKVEFVTGTTARFSPDGDADAIIAFYDENGSLTQTIKKRISKEESVSFDKPVSGYVKLMLWKDMKPITGVVCRKY